MKQTLLNNDARGGYLDNRQSRIINTGCRSRSGSWSGCDVGGGGRKGGTGCTRGRRGAGATHRTGIAEALSAVVLLRPVEEAQVELTAGVERHFRREGVRRRGAAQTRAQRLIEFENVHCTGIERSSTSLLPGDDAFSVHGASDTRGTLLYVCKILATRYLIFSRTDERIKWLSSHSRIRMCPQLWYVFCLLCDDELSQWDNKTAIDFNKLDELLGASWRSALWYFEACSSNFVQQLNFPSLLLYPNRVTSFWSVCIFRMKDVLCQGEHWSAHLAQIEPNSQDMSSVKLFYHLLYVSWERYLAVCRFIQHFIKCGFLLFLNKAIYS